MTEFVDDNGNYLDYTGDDFAITKQAAVFNNFKIKGDVSLTFSLANNSHNRKTLGYYGLNQKTNAALSKHAFTLVRNGNSMARGYIMISDDDGETLKAFFLSGNSNWIKRFDFSCKDIRNPDFQVQWNTTQIDNRRTATEGIIFPVIDYAFRRNHYGNRIGVEIGLFTTTSGPAMQSRSQPPYPCLYVHTLVDELSKVANIKLAGDLFSDRLYKTIIITGDGPTFVDPATQRQVFYQTGTLGDHITIGSIAPKMDAVEFIKWLAVSFGCICYFDDYSQTLTMNIVDNFKKEDAEDWSDYFISARGEYDKVNQNNYIRMQDPPEDELEKYNKVNEVKWGELNIQSDKDDGSETDVYKSPFLPVKDDIGTVNTLYASPYVEFFKLEDDGSFVFTAGGNNGGRIQFTGLTNFQPTGKNFIFRVEDNSGIYNGYHTGSASPTVLNSAEAYVSNSGGGTIFPQKVTEVSAGHRILVCIPNISVKDISSLVSFDISSDGTPDLKTNVAWAYYFKPQYPYSTLLHNKKGLSYGEVNTTGYNDVSLSEGYMNRFKKMITNPPLVATMRLPESVYQKYKFNKFVFIKSEKLTGYFIVQKIDEYVAGATPVEVELLYAD